MGRMQAEEMARLASLDAGLHWHLTANHYPPHPTSMIEPAKQAILSARRGEWEAKVLLPEGVTHKRYGRGVPAKVLIESLHLESWVEEGEEE